MFSLMGWLILLSPLCGCSTCLVCFSRPSLSILLRPESCLPKVACTCYTNFSSLILGFLCKLFLIFWSFYSCKVFSEHRVVAIYIIKKGKLVWTCGFLAFVKSCLFLGHPFFFPPFQCFVSCQLHVRSAWWGSDCKRDWCFNRRKFLYLYNFLWL